MAMTLTLTFAMAGKEARALDKQGAAHQGDSATAVTGFHLSGQTFFGVLPYNPSYAARPDNSGHALFRAGGHADVDLIGERLFVPLDLNMFTDRDVSALRPSELDFIGGVASTWGVPGGSAEVGARGEVDGTIDGRGVSQGQNQSYLDVRARYVVSLADHVAAIDPLLGGGDVSGWLTLGWFAWNPGYYARPDNSGTALLRYVLHSDVSFWRGRLTAIVDATFFTDRNTSPLRPSELDMTVGAALTVGVWAAQVAYERDMPVDGRSVTGLTQQTLMMQGSWSFSWNGPGSRQAPPSP